MLSIFMCEHSYSSDSYNVRVKM
jgi:hypothetical protein